MPKIAAVTVLYNPNEEVITNILSYSNQIDKLYIVDNSEKENKKNIISRLISNPQVTLIENSENIGIAAALNKGANNAISDGYDFLLTLDQDSRISEEYVCKMLKELGGDDNIGILSPFVIHNANRKKPPNFELKKVTVAITSGCIISLFVFKKIGGFLEKLFIDYVDHEYCLRTISCGYKVLQLNSVYLYHNLGEVQKKNFILRKVFPTNHSPLRWYYRTRNRFYVYKNYKERFPEYVRHDQEQFLKELLKILLYEKQKWEKVKMIFEGYRDYKKNRFGKFT